MEVNISLDPVDVGFLGFIGVVVESEFFADLIQESGFAGLDLSGGSNHGFTSVFDPWLPPYQTTYSI